MDIQNKIINKIGILTINREKVLNDLTPEVLKELNQLVISFIKNKKIGVIIITGSGKKAFIAGADIKIMKSLDKKGGYEFSKLGQEVTQTIETSPKPIIAAVNGFALGGGCEISLACHLRFASDNAKFGQPEVRIGLIPGWGGTQRLPRIIGKGHAIELITGGQLIDSKKAFRIGLVNNVFAPDDLLKEVIKFAELILLNGPIALTDSLYCINIAAEKPISEGLEIEAKIFGDRFESKETIEGLSAFIEKRKPSFSS